MLLSYFNQSLDVDETLGRFILSKYVSWGWVPTTMRTSGFMRITFDFQNSVQSFLDAVPDASLASSYFDFLNKFQAIGRSNGKLLLLNFDIVPQ
uniref:P10 n=1 Tax=Jasmine virus A associated satellite virus TaxID=3080343 RepID=A0AA96WM66_9VIRU|nr:p10 [Jasmine virus A associated satellite virus]